MSRPAVKLSALRAIGWRCWDPIGLFDMVGGGYNSGSADEYDSYLLTAFGMTQNGRSANEVATYLVQIASVHMGLSNVDGAAEKETAKRLLELARSLDMIS